MNKDKIVKALELIQEALKEESPNPPPSLTFDFQDGKGPVAAKRHKNSDGSEGGWVADTARVDSTCYIGPNARVSGNACVYENARVSGNACVYENARVYGNALVYENAHVYGNAKVYEDAWVYGNARVSGDAWVYGDAEILKGYFTSHN